jgi:hypothetical protein
MELGVVRPRPMLVFAVQSPYSDPIIKTSQAKPQVGGLKYGSVRLLNKIPPPVNHLTSQLAYKLNSNNVT